MGDHAPREMTVRALLRARQNPAYRPATELLWISPLYLNCDTGGWLFLLILSIENYLVTYMCTLESRAKSIRQRLTFSCTKVLTCWMLTACVSHQTSPPRETAPTQTPAAVTPDTARSTISLLQIYEPGILRYQVELRSVVEPIVGDSIHHADSTRTRATIVVQLNQSSDKNTITAGIQIDSISSQSSSNVAIPRVSQLMSFRINSKTGQVAKEKESALHSECADTASSTTLFSGTEVLPVIGPLRTTVWTDSSQTQNCRGHVRVSLSRIANYTTLKQDSLDTQILRVTHVGLTGTGSQWNQSVEVTGQGIATDTLVLVRSRLIRISGNSQLKIDFHSSLRNQQYMQSITTKIELQP